MIELGKKYQTRDGRAVRILATDMKNAYTVVGIVTPSISCLNEFAEVWTSAGESLVHDMGIQNDLIPVPTKHEGWVARQDILSSEKSLREAWGILCPIVHVTWED